MRSAVGCPFALRIERPDSRGEWRVYKTYAGMLKAMNKMTKEHPNWVLFDYHRGSYHQLALFDETDW